jgi:hypothetical protein
MKNQQDTLQESSVRDVVLSFLQGLNEHDYDRSRALVSDRLQFKGVMGSRNGAEDYFNDMKRMQFHYDIRKVFDDGDDVCVFYDINMGGNVIFCCGWYHLEEGKIATIRVVFDPRPLREK